MIKMIDYKRLRVDLIVLWFIFLLLFLFIVFVNNDFYESLGVIIFVYMFIPFHAMVNKYKEK